MNDDIQFLSDLEEIIGNRLQFFLLLFGWIMALIRFWFLICLTICGSKRVPPLPMALMSTSICSGVAKL